MVGSSLIHWKCSPGLYWNVGRGFFSVQRNSGAGWCAAGRGSRDKALLEEPILQDGGWWLTARLPLIGFSPPKSKPVELTPSDKARDESSCFQSFWLYFQPGWCPWCYREKEAHRSLVSVLGNLPFIILTNTGQGQESRSKKNEINQQNNWEARIDVTQCSLGFICLYPTYFKKNSIRATLDCLLVSSLRAPFRIHLHNSHNSHPLSKLSNIKSNK